MKSIGLYSHGMHDFVLRECEIGTRAASAEDDEYCGFGPLLDLQFRLYMKEQDDHLE